MDGKVEVAQGSSWKRLSPIFFIATVLLQLALYQWPRRWLVSGAPALTFVILQGEASGNRIFQCTHIWSALTTVNLAYAIASTSWLLYWVFTAFCYPTIFITCLFQFRIVGILTRQAMRTLIKQLHFIDDKIALFDIPALEIDTEVDGLMVLHGVTLSLSTLSFVIHGIEVGIKLSDDMELAIRTEKISVWLFRKIEVGDCFANLKGGEHEMTFGNMEGKTKDEDGDALLTSDMSLGNSASKTRPELVKMKSQMTDGSPPEDSSPKAAVRDVKRHYLDNGLADQKYQHMLACIDDASAIQQARKHIKLLNKKTGDTPMTTDKTDQDALRAAICSQLYQMPSVPNPPRRSIKVTTLRNLSSPWVKRFTHRLPMLLRLLLNPLSYFHPVKVSSIIATASGDWIETMLVQKIFKEYGDSDSEIQRLTSRIFGWLSGAHFAVELGNVAGTAHVPLTPSYNIDCRLGCEDVAVYRALPGEANPNQVMRLYGADAAFNVPTFLLPHHEHLLPPMPTQETKKDLVGEAEDAENKAGGVQNQHRLRAAEKDEASVRVSVRASLPARFDQELLDFITALVKACKLIDVEQGPSPLDEDVHKVSEITGSLNQKIKDGLKKAVVANDRWLAKLVGKVMTKLEEVKGDFGYSWDIAVGLRGYRETGWLDEEGRKLLS